jgi:ATP-binding cassette subfamily B protein
MKSCGREPAVICYQPEIILWINRQPCIINRYMPEEAPWRTIARLALPYRRQLLFVLMLAGLSTVADLIEPLIYRIAINDIAGIFIERTEQKAVPPAARPAAARQRAKATPEPHQRGRVAPRTPDQTLTTLTWAVALLFAVNICGYFFWLLSDNMSVRLASRIEQSFIQKVFAHVLRLPLSFFGQRASGALAKQIDQSDQVAPIVNAFAQQIAPEAIRVVGILVIMLTQSRLLTAISLATIPPYLWLARASANRLEVTLPKYYELWEQVSARIQDALAGIKTVKLAGAEAREVRVFQTVSTSAYDTHLKRTRQANRYVFLEVFVTQLGKALMLGYGGWLALRHELTPGDVVMFVAYLDRLYDPIGSLANLGVELQQNAASLARAFRLMRMGEEETGGAPLGPGPGRVEFKEVTFGYSRGREVLRGVSFIIEPGLMTAMVGPSGAGKTTTADLLLRLYKPDSGTILLDGQPLSGLDASSVRREIGVVAADGAVFSGTLADSIRYIRPDATDREVMDAAIAAGLAGAIERLPEGLGTRVGERGVGLSAGERQRLQLARVLLANPRVLVLDEATSNLDYFTEAEIKQTLGRLRRGRTTILIAHRYSMVKDADRVLVLEAGKIIEAGTPEELVRKGGWFADLASRTAADVPPAEVPEQIEE